MDVISSSVLGGAIPKDRIPACAAIDALVQISCDMIAFDAVLGTRATDARVIRARAIIVGRVIQYDTASNYHNAIARPEGNAGSLDQTRLVGANPYAVV